MTIEDKNQGSNPDDAAVEQALTGSADDFFNALEDNVNSAIQDDPSPEQVTPLKGDSSVTGSKSDPEAEVDNLKKRYSDSSREAQKIKAQLDELKPFVPVLEAMKNDSGLVEHVRDYFTSGGQPSKTVAEKLDLPEDFIFDGHEAVTDPDSDSAKVMNAHVDKLVSSRVGGILQNEKANAVAVQRQVSQQRDIEEFKSRHGMTEEEFGQLTAWAKERPLQLEDIYFLKNKEQGQANVEKATRNDMLNQMKNVRNMPTSQSNANSVGKDSSPEGMVFNAIKGLDDDLDNLFDG